MKSDQQKEVTRPNLKRELVNEDYKEKAVWKVQLQRVL